MFLPGRVALRISCPRPSELGPVLDAELIPLKAHIPRTLSRGSSAAAAAEAAQAKLRSTQQAARELCVFAKEPRPLVDVSERHLYVQIDSVDYSRETKGSVYASVYVCEDDSAIDGVRVLFVWCCFTYGVASLLSLL